jgi:hypothetical protein
VKTAGARHGIVPLRQPSKEEGRMPVTIQRRDLLAALGSAAVWPLVAHTQAAGRLRRVVVLMGIANDTEAQARALALHQGLQALGWILGRKYPDRL